MKKSCYSTRYGIHLRNPCNRFITMTIGIAGCLALLSIALNMACVRTHQDPFLHESKIEGYVKTGIREVYDKEDIFDYLNGEAEAYFPYGFRMLFIQGYRKNHTDEQVIVEAYDMGGPEGAKGIFESYTREGGKGVRGLGDAAWTDSHLVLFHTGRYFL